MTEEEMRKTEAERQRVYREVNREKIADRKRKYYLANRCKEIERALAWREVNRDKERVRQRAYREANREKFAEKDRAYREGNLEAIREKDRVRNSAYRAKAIETLADSYVARTLSLPVRAVPRQLLEAKREQLLTYRCIKQLQTTLKEKETT